MTTGLLVKVSKSRTHSWTGTAHPYEESVLYRQKVMHPAGRIDLNMTPGMTHRSVIILFAHELRHIGQFNRGRKRTGVLNIEYGMTGKQAEIDCFEFEKMVAGSLMRGAESYKGLYVPDGINSLLYQSRMP